MECSGSYEEASSSRFFLIHPGLGMGEGRPAEKLNRCVPY